MDKLVYSVSEAARLVGIHPITLYRFIERGQINLRVIHLGRRVLVPRQALDEFLAGGGAAPRRPGRPRKIAGGAA